MSLFRQLLFSGIVASSALIAVVPAQAETILGALAKAYENNASLNSARAGVRVTNETVPIAKSGWRPIVGGQGQVNYQTQSGGDVFTGSFGVSIQQSVFDGFQTLNNVRAAEVRVLASNEGLRSTEQSTLFNAVEAYMNVIRDRQIAVFRASNLEQVDEQVRAATSRFEVGEGTRTDVAQTEANRASAVAQLALARAQADASAGIYRQIIGEDPGNLSMASPLTNLMPQSRDVAFTLAATEHPAILAALHLVDAADYVIKAAEGGLLPQVSASAGVSTTYRDASGGSGITDPSLPGVGMGGGGSSTTNSANVGINLTVPIYDGGRTAGQVRLSKEELSQTRIEVDVTRDLVRQAVASAWGQYIAAREASSANRQLVSSAQLALDGVIEERNVGQRTTLNVLESQADVVNAQINLASSERDVVVGSYAVVLAMGRLSARNLNLAVSLHDPREHYEAVKDKWHGTRTPDGR